MLGTAIGACEECILACQSDRSDGAFEDVGIQLDPAVIEKQGEVFPAIVPSGKRKWTLIRFVIFNEVFPDRSPLSCQSSASADDHIMCFTNAGI